MVVNSKEAEPGTERIMQLALFRLTCETEVMRGRMKKQKIMLFTLDWNDTLVYRI